MKKPNPLEDWKDWKPEPFTFERPHLHWTPAHWQDAVANRETELGYNDWVTERMGSNDLPKQLPE